MISTQISVCCTEVDIKHALVDSNPNLSEKGLVQKYFTVFDQWYITSHTTCVGQYAPGPIPIPYRGIIRMGYPMEYSYLSDRYRQSRITERTNACSLGLRQIEQQLFHTLISDSYQVRSLTNDSNTIVLSYDLVARPTEPASPQATHSLNTQVAHLPVEYRQSHRVTIRAIRSILSSRPFDCSNMQCYSQSAMQPRSSGKSGRNISATANPNIISIPDFLLEQIKSLSKLISEIIDRVFDRHFPLKPTPSTSANHVPNAYLHGRVRLTSEAQAKREKP